MLTIILEGKNASDTVKLALKTIWVAGEKCSRKNLGAKIQEGLWLASYFGFYFLCLGNWQNLY